MRLPFEPSHHSEIAEDSVLELARPRKAGSPCSEPYRERFGGRSSTGTHACGSSFHKPERRDGERACMT